jgi:beta-phosphoglucomutase-like phosphatase (HAD superfamily)
MGIPPEACWVIEDSLAGIAAARAAGMTAVGFTGGSHCPANQDERLRLAGASRIVARMEDLAALLASVVA